MTARPNDDPETRAALDGWITDLAAELGLDPGEVDTDAVLALAGAIAHRVVRPAAPVTTYLAGLRVGQAIARGEDPAAAFRDTVERARRLAEGTPPAS